MQSITKYIALAVCTAAFAASATSCAKRVTASGSHEVSNMIPPVEPGEPVAEIGGSVAALPHAVIYKTRADYSQLVPITLSADKKTVVSYPAPGDVAGGEPTMLSSGYMLDNRGIGRNSVFTKWTYAEYQKLPQAPSPKQLLESVADNDPFTEIYVTDAPRTDAMDAAYFSKLISSGFPGCKRIK